MPQIPPWAPLVPSASPKLQVASCTLVIGNFHPLSILLEFETHICIINKIHHIQLERNTNNQISQFMPCIIIFLWHRNNNNNILKRKWVKTRKSPKMYALFNTSCWKGMNVMVKTQKSPKMYALFNTSYWKGMNVVVKTRKSPKMHAWKGGGNNLCLV